MQITVKLFASFRNGRFVTAVQELADGTSIAQIIDSLHLTREEVGTIMLNSRHATPEQELCDGDRLALFPLVGGG